MQRIKLFSTGVLLILLTSLTSIIFLSSFFNHKEITKTKKIVTGADQVSSYLSYLKGKRIGMVVNQTSIIGNKPSVDSLFLLGLPLPEFLAQSMDLEAMPVMVPRSIMKQTQKQEFLLFPYMANIINPPKKTWQLLIY